MRRLLIPLLATAGLFAVSSCGSGDSAVCVERGDAKVCAERSGGSIEFSGSGLQPESAVLIDNAEAGLSVYEIDDDGTFDPNGRAVMSLIEGMPFTFTVTATSADGELIEGEIDIST